MHGNTLEIPVYWDIVEPEEGKFDFTMVDKLLASARRFEIKFDFVMVRDLEKRQHGLTSGMGQNQSETVKRVISPKRQRCLEPLVALQRQSGSR